MTPEEALLKAKIKLMSKSTFISSVCLSLKHKFTRSIQQAGTDGVTAFYNPDFFMDISPGGQLFVVAHEVWHVGFSHITRCGARDKKKYNKAADHVINLMLKEEGYSLTASVCCDSAYKNMMTEEVYKLLPDEPEEDPNSGKLSLDGDLLDPPDNMSEEELQQHIDEIIVKARTQSKIASKYFNEVPGEIQRSIEKIVNPKIPWQIHLYRFMQDFCKDDASWSRPNRRFMPDFYLPSFHVPAMKHVVVAFDSSGSVTMEETAIMLSETQSLKNQFQPDKLTILDCDCILNQVVEAELIDNLMSITLKGGGGTKIEPVLDWCKKNPPTCLIYFSDMCFEFPSEEPSYPILWINTDDYVNSIPGKWGKMINMR
jgi:predicted metal-dependent peptidase